jgi:hypothetical protein
MLAMSMDVRLFDEQSRLSRLVNVETSIEFLELALQFKVFRFGKREKLNVENGFAEQSKC